MATGLVHMAVMGGTEKPVPRLCHGAGCWLELASPDLNEVNCPRCRKIAGAIYKQITGVPLLVGTEVFK